MDRLSRTERALREPHLTSGRGRCLIIINDVQTAVDLLEKRSTIYSSRPESAIVELSGWGGWAFPFMSYSQHGRDGRRALWEYFSPAAVRQYDARLENSARRLLGALLDSPDKLDDVIRYSFGATFIEMAYGLPNQEDKNKIVDEFEDALTSMNIMVSGTSLLEFLPVLGRVPTWLPGTSFLRLLEHYRKVMVTVRELPWDMVKSAVAAGNAIPSIASGLLEDISHLEGDQASAKETASKSTLTLIYAGGVDSTHTSLCSFFVAMSLHPEVQKKAQEELDRVVGPTRLPKYADRKNLPYVNAIVKETLRWHVVVPLGFPHVNDADDEYKGYVIPKKSIVMVNVWSITRDPTMYPNPERFDPERYLKDGKPTPDATDPTTIAFGFGRRSCPGKHFVDAALFIYIASALHTFNISPPLDENGRPIHVEPRGTNGIMSKLEDCRCTIRPRSSSTEALIRNWGVNTA
ncbi:cytochrome P450 [Fomes fomentarius]|nr:cytochrome P450 [Fomes fomentarius]